MSSDGTAPNKCAFGVFDARGPPDRSVLHLRELLRGMQQHSLPGIATSDEAWHSSVAPVILFMLGGAGSYVGRVSRQAFEDTWSDLRVFLGLLRGCYAEGPTGAGGASAHFASGGVITPWDSTGNVLLRVDLWASMRVFEVLNALKAVKESCERERC